MRIRRTASRLRRLPLFDLWPGGRFRRRSDALEWYAWAAAALLVALAVPLAFVAVLFAHQTLADTAREQRADPDRTVVAGAPLGGFEVAVYSAGVGVAVEGAAVGAAASGIWLARRRLARRRDLEWTADWRCVAPAWLGEYGGGGRIPDTTDI